MLRRKEVGVAGLREVGRGSRVGKVGRSWLCRELEGSSPVWYTVNY